MKIPSVVLELLYVNRQTERNGETNIRSFSNFVKKAADCNISVFFTFYFDICEFLLSLSFGTSMLKLWNFILEMFLYPF
jgi:hypothetical protein